VNELEQNYDHETQQTYAHKDATGCSLRFGHWLTLYTLTMPLLTYLLT